MLLNHMIFIMHGICLSLLRCMWQRLSAVRMFIELVCLSQVQLEPQDVQNIIKLWKVRTSFSAGKVNNLVTITKVIIYYHY